MSVKKVIIVTSLVLLLVILAGTLIHVTSAETRYYRQLKLGEKYLLECEYEKAIVAFNKAIQIDPKSVEPRLGIAKAYIGLEKFEDAKSALEEALKIDSNHAEAQLALANLLKLAFNGEENAASKPIDVQPTEEPSAAPTSTPAQEETAAPNEDWKTIYKEFLMQYSEPEGDNVLFGMALMDVNGDGLPELVLSSSAYMRSNYIYTISGGKVTQLGGFTTNYQGEVSSNLDASLYKNKKTNKIQWVAKAGASEGDDDGLRTTLIDMNPEWYKTPGFFAYTDTSKNVKHWMVNNTEGSEAVYKEKYMAAFDVLEILPYTARQYKWDPKSNTSEREPIIMKMLQEYRPFSLTQSVAKPRLQFAVYYPESSNTSAQKDFDLDGSTDNLTLTRDSGAPKLTLDMKQNGILTFELTEYEYGSFNKIMSGDITGDGSPEILILADMGGNGLAAGSCALYGFTRMNGEWSAIDFPFLEYGAIRTDHIFEGKFLSKDVIGVHCMPTNQRVDTINNNNLQFKNNYLEQTYQSGDLTQILFEAGKDSAAYDLLLLQEMRNDNASEVVGSGVSKYSFKGGWKLVSQMFHFKQDYPGR